MAGRKGEATGSGPGATPVGAAKLFLDGADACRVCLTQRQMAATASRTILLAAGGASLAALRASFGGERWRRGPGRLLRRGFAFYEQRELDAVVREAAGHGLQIAQHAIGNGAIGRALLALDRSEAALGGLPGRPRMEHTMLFDDVQAAHIADIGAVAVVQPLWIAEFGDRLALTPLPMNVLGLGTLARAGVELAGSSD